MSERLHKTFLPGSIVRLHAPIGDAWSAMRIEHVLVLDQPVKPFNASHPEVRVAPIAPITQFAAEFDVFGRTGDGGMTSDFLIELWNQRAILIEELETTPVGIVVHPTLRVIYAIHNAMFDIEPADRLALGEVGDPITEATDPRIGYQQERAQSAQALSRRANMLWDSSSDDQWASAQLESASRHVLSAGLRAQRYVRAARAMQALVHINYAEQNLRQTGEFAAIDGPFASAA